jgi:hypothetical protein
MKTRFILAVLLVAVVLPPIYPSASAAAGACITPAQVAADASLKVVRHSDAVFGQRKTWLYGDSITVQSWGGLALPSLAVDARWGRPITEGVDHFASNLARFGAPKTVIIALGTNDMLAPDTVKQQLRRVRGLLPLSTRVVYVTAYRSNQVAESLAVNNAARTVPLVRFVNWYIAASRPGMLIDNAHVTCPAGADTRDLLIRAQVLAP